MAVETIDRVAADIGNEARRVSSEVDALFGQLLGNPGDGRDRLYAALRHAAIGGGKRLRPLLTIAASRLFGIAEDRAMRVGTAIEAIHVYSLIHDDLPCMDDDDLRRGKPTVHKAFGEAIAVLAGDSLHAMAFEMLADPKTHEDPFVRSDLVLELARASGPAGMAGGQMMDLAAESGALNLAAITRLQQLKTGALIEFAVEAAAGKRVGKDANAGKATFVVLLGEERARQQAALLVDQAIEHLATYGEEANLLRAIARFAIERDH